MQELWLHRHKTLRLVPVRRNILVEPEDTRGSNRFAHGRTTMGRLRLDLPCWGRGQSGEPHGAACVVA